MTEAHRTPLPADDVAAPLRPGQYLGRPLARHRGRDFSITESTYAADAKLPVHSHALAHFCLVIGGSYTEHLDGRTRLRQPGDLIFYPPESRHAEVHHEPGRHLMIEIDAPLLERAAALGELPTEPGACDRATRWTAGRLVEALRTPRGSSPLLLEGLTLELLGRVVGALDGPDRETAPGWLLDALEAARAAMPQPPDLTELSESVGLHPSHVSRTIRRHLATSYGALVRRWRLETARHLLLVSDLALSEVALEAGYCDQSHMTRAFRTAIGTTPAAFREAHG